jgi:crotonobetainyl-CoA:carnitine CoA-transferase CaiB-like acyl-CoA transferase
VELVQDYEDIANDPQVAANGYIVEMDWPGHDEPFHMVNSPIRFSKTPAHIRSLAPAFGQHTEEVLLELGLSREEVRRLEEQGIVVMAKEAEEPAAP